MRIAPPDRYSVRVLPVNNRPLLMNPAANSASWPSWPPVPNAPSASCNSRIMSEVSDSSVMLPLLATRTFETLKLASLLTLTWPALACKSLSNRPLWVLPKPSKPLNRRLPEPALALSSSTETAIAATVPVATRLSDLAETLGIARLLSVSEMLPAAARLTSPPSATAAFAADRSDKRVT